MATKKSPQKAAQKQKPPLPNITASIDRLVPTEGDGVKALASITIGGHYAIHGFKVYESEEKGLSVLCPATKSEKNGKYWYTPVTASDKALIADTVLDDVGMYQSEGMAMSL